MHDLASRGRHSSLPPLRQRRATSATRPHCSARLTLSSAFSFLLPGRRPQLTAQRRQQAPRAALLLSRQQLCQRQASQQALLLPAGLPVRGKCRGPQVHTALALHSECLLLR